MTMMLQATNRLRCMILDMDIGPGERLTERWLEGQLGVSRTSVRTALFRLEAEGLVRRQGRGWMVPPIDLVEIEQLFTYREVLEVAALQLGGYGIRDRAFEQAEVVLNAATTDRSPEEMESAGMQFHLWIAELAENRFIRDGVRDAMTRLQRARWLETDARHHGWEEHRAIVAALRQGDTDRAIALIKAHTRTTRDRLVEALRKSRRSLRASGALMRSPEDQP